MKIVYVANYMNHHYLPLCLSLKNNNDVDFKFIATEPFESSRSNIGYADLNTSYDFIVRSYENKKSELLAQSIIDQADVVMYGFFGNLRIKKTTNNLVFNVTERIFKEKNNFILFLLRYFKYFFQKRKRSKHVLLPMSAYAVNDFRLVNLFKGDTYKWGYFTETRYYQNQDLFSKKNHKNPTIIWAGRLIKLKHLDDVIRAISLLKKDGFCFVLEIVGDGPELNAAKQLSCELGVCDIIVFKGALSPDEVRDEMEKSNIFVISSDKREGWGAVLNEAMNSGCCCIASKAIGSAPFLIRHNYNGLFYDGSVDDLYKKIKSVLTDKEHGLLMGKNAYDTIINLWSPEIAGKRLIELCKRQLQSNSDKRIFLYDDGPLSRAGCIKDGWNDYEKGIR